MSERRGPKHFSRRRLLSFLGAGAAAVGLHMYADNEARTLDERRMLLEKGMRRDPTFYIDDDGVKTSRGLEIIAFAPLYFDPSIQNRQNPINEVARDKIISIGEIPIKEWAKNMIAWNTRLVVEGDSFFVPLPTQIIFDRHPVDAISYYSIPLTEDFIKIPKIPITKDPKGVLIDPSHRPIPEMRFTRK